MRRRREVGQALAMLPMMVPHILISLAPSRAHALSGARARRAGDRHVLICLPFTITGLSRASRRRCGLEAAAYTLGASRLRVLAEVTLPLVAPGVLSALIFSFIISFGDVDIALFLSGPA